MTWLLRLQMLMPLVAEELAEELGVKPSFWKLLLTNPSLALKTQLGPALPVLYRIHGPQALPNAAELYRQAVARTSAVPLQAQGNTASTGHLFIALCFGLIAVLVVLLLS